MSLEEIRNKLEKERNELLLVLKDYEESKEILKETVSSADEIADRYEYKEEIHLKKEILEERLQKIERALKRIDEGKFGFCEKCGQKIEEMRLKIDPAVDLCQSCAVK